MTIKLIAGHLYVHRDGTHCPLLALYDPVNREIRRVQLWKDTDGSLLSPQTSTLSDMWVDMGNISKALYNKCNSQEVLDAL